MKYNKTLALIPAFLLAACGGDEQSVNTKTTPGSVIYSYPADGQHGVSPKADIVLRFSHAITDEDPASKIQVSGDAGTIDYSLTRVDGGRSLKLAPASTLEVNRDYSIEFTDALEAQGGRIVANPNATHDDEPGNQFTTRNSFSGIRSLENSSNSFKVTSMVPRAGSEFEPMNFSTFRLTLSQPVHPRWQAQGGKVELLDKNNEVVPATVLVKDNRVTLDPCVTAAPENCGSKDDVLNAGETYTLKISNLPSKTASAEPLSFSHEFTPRDTGPTVVLQQSAVDSGLASGQSVENATKSILNGQPINGVTLNSVLQGVAGPSQQNGDMFAELAYAPGFAADEALPLRVPKGSVLTSTSLDVLVGGKVPALDAATGELQTTGDIKVTMLSDASGYMSPNSYTDDVGAPRQITLFMDVSMNAEEPQPNAALSQDLMGVELRGIALVRDGVLTIDAIGMVEPGLLGQEYTDSTIAFHLVAATDAESALDADSLREIDQTSPRLVSWMPGDKENAIPATRQSMQRPGDPVILFFDEPLAPDSMADGVSLYADGVEMSLDDTLRAELDGTALTLNLNDGFKAGVQYTVSVTGLKDLAGNLVDKEQLDFQLDGQKNSLSDAPPLALTTYPGFPCETTHDAIDLDNRTHGQCWDAAPNGEAGDVLPLSEMPADRPITVVFSQPMNLDSIRLNETFIVEKVDAEKNRIPTDSNDGNVSGRLEKNNQRIRFYPDEPWEEGAFYRYTMKVVRDSALAQEDASCLGDKTESICGENNFALKTDLLEGLEKGNGNGDGGDNSMIIYFEGAPAQDSVFTALRNLPVRDVNANFKIDDNEPFAHTADGSGGYSPSANSAKLLVNVKDGQEREARVGCAVGEQNTDKCERNKFIYQAYALNTEVVGATKVTVNGQEKDALEVLLYPTSIATTSLKVHTNLFDIASITNTQILRMRYAKSPDCESGAENCRRDSLIPGMIIEDDSGQPVFKTTVDVFLDAPDLELDSVLTVEHNLYSYPFTLELEGDVTFFDDGRMQIEQYNLNAPEINVKSEVLSGIVKKTIPLFIPEKGLYLNFISNPVKEIPVEL